MIDRRTFLAAFLASAAPALQALPSHSLYVADGTIRGTLTLVVDAAPLQQAVLSLQAAAQAFAGVRDVLPDLLFEGGDSLAHGLIEFRNVPAGGARCGSIVLDCSQRLREIVAAARAGEVDRLRSYRIVQVHGGPRGE